ncbi:MAG: RNA polymerase subunit sigma-70 [SAR202 cluster bacterium Io17-Chloro-G9]|nr:MAG: RNA polymerase subunit sigma-70 [SAR202 cluster bacterium Io17-Chloro-G9]
MARDWQELTKLSGGEPMVVQRVRLGDSDTAIEGNFDLPPLARLPAEDQVFIMVFVRSHGSIKEMERVFGISYPTVKNRLNRISDQLDLVETDPVPTQSEVLSLLRQGEISASEAIERLSR